MRNKLIIYFILLIVSVTGTAYLIFIKEYYYAIPAFVILVISSFLMIKEYKANTRKITYMLNALENNDSSFRFKTNKGDKYDFLFNTTLNRINEMLANEKITTRENEKYFELMLNNVITGIITIDPMGNIINSNTKALEIFGLPVLTHISQLLKVDENLYNCLSEDQPSPQEGHIISFYNESGEVHLSLKFSYITIRGKKLKIVAINDIGDELEEKEQESWTRLIRVLTHEIMNTVTPISSLSETLSMMVNNDSSPDESEHVKAEIKNGLDVISTTSKGLISFVDTYRTLTRIPTPDKKAIYVKDLIHRVTTLMRDDFVHANIVPDVSFSDESIMIYADENLISQVLINLVKNAIAAFSDYQAVSIPFVRVKVFLDQNKEDVIIEVANNGKPINKEDQEHIFVPFFTTKSSGTGIGLSISRQIMRQHNGSLKLKCSTEAETAFLLIFR